MLCDLLRCDSNPSVSMFSDTQLNFSAIFLLLQLALLLPADLRSSLYKFLVYPVVKRRYAKIRQAVFCDCDDTFSSI